MFTFLAVIWGDLLAYRSIDFHHVLTFLVFFTCGLTTCHSNLTASDFRLFEVVPENPSKTSRGPDMCLQGPQGPPRGTLGDPLGQGQRAPARALLPLKPLQRALLPLPCPSTKWRDRQGEGKRGLGGAARQPAPAFAPCRAFTLEWRS